MAVKARVPAVIAVVEHVATPALTGCAVQPEMATPALRNSTVPLMVPVPGDVTVSVAVNVVDCPNVVGLTDDVSAEVVLALFTTCVSGPVEVRKLPSPE